MDKAYCQFALCGPSRTSLLTSRLPERMQVLANRNLNWRRDWTTKDVYSLPQYYKEHGYRTKSIGKIFHPIGRHSGNNPDDYQKSWTDPPFFVDPLVISYGYSQSLTACWGDFNSKELSFQKFLQNPFLGCQWNVLKGK